MKPQKRDVNEKTCSKKPKQIDSKHAANTETLQNQKHTKPENKCNRKQLHIQQKFARPLGEHLVEQLDLRRKVE